MKFKYLKTLTICFLFSLSVGSFVYLNFGIAPNHPQPAKTATYQESDTANTERKMFVEIALIKVLIGKIKEVVEFKIG